MNKKLKKLQDGMKCSFLWKFKLSILCVRLYYLMTMSRRGYEYFTKIKINLHVGILSGLPKETTDDGLF